MMRIRRSCKVYTATIQVLLGSIFHERRRAMTFTVHGIDGFLHLIAVLCFLVAAVFGWTRAGHRLVLVLIAAGLFCWVLTTILR